MKIDALIDMLNYIADNLRDPTYNSLEVGFRHGPLTQKEKIERYEQECYCSRNDILKLVEMIKTQGIDND
jgi:hypothetical protein